MSNGVKELVRKGIDDSFVGEVDNLFDTLVANLIAEKGGVKIENDPDKPIVKFRKGLNLMIEAYVMAANEVDRV